MLRKTAKIAAVLALSLLASGSASAATPDDFTVLAKEYAGHGDEHNFVFRERLYSHGKQVGRDRIRLVRRGKRITATGIFRFHDGTIFAHGRLKRGRDHQRIDITGGKGAYKGVRGTLNVVGAGRKRERETFRFD